MNTSVESTGLKWFGGTSVIPHFLCLFLLMALAACQSKLEIEGDGNDSAVPGVTINQVSGATDPTNALPIEFDVVFTEPINETTFTVADITQDGTATGITWTITNSGDNKNFTLRATAVTTGGSVIPSIDDGTVTGLLGSSNTTSTSTDNSVTYTSGPSVTIEQEGAQSDQTASLPINFTVTFSEAIDPASFTDADITQDGSATGITWSLATVDNIIWTLSATAVTGQGTLIPSIDGSVVQDLSGNDNVASTSTDNSVTYDNVGPTVTVEQAVGQSDPINTASINFTVTFSEAIDPGTFTIVDITDGGAATGTWSLSNVNSTTWTLTATSVTGTGTLIPSIGINKVKDLAGNDNAASTSADNTVTYETVGPTVTVEQAVGQSDPINGLPINFTVTFSEAINPGSFTTADITQSGTATGITWSLSTGDNITWTLSATAVTGAGTLIPSIAISKVKDLAGNDNAASTSGDQTVTYDTTVPTVTINQAAAQTDPSVVDPVFTVVFSEAIKPATFTDADITQGGSSTGITWSLSTGDNITWTLTATGASDGTVVPSIAASGVEDLAGNLNSASTSTDNSVTRGSLAFTEGTTYSYGVSLNTNTDKMFTLLNSTGVQSGVLNISITGADAAQFVYAYVGGDDCVSATTDLNPSDDCTIWVRFMAGANGMVDGTYNANLEVTSSIGTATIALSGSTAYTWGAGDYWIFAASDGAAAPSAACAKGDSYIQEIDAVPTGAQVEYTDSGAQGVCTPGNNQYDVGNPSVIRFCVQGAQENFVWPTLTTCLPTGSGATVWAGITPLVGSNSAVGICVGPEPGFIPGGTGVYGRKWKCQ